MLCVGVAFVTLPNAFLHLGCANNRDDSSSKPDGLSDESTRLPDKKLKGTSMKIQYLEIVTPDVNDVCETYSQLHKITFGDADQNLGGARTAKMSNGGMLGIRAPMHDAEKPVTRHYMLVDNIKTTVDLASKSGATVAVPPMQLGDHGTCAIVIQGGIEFGFWQL